MIHNTIINKTWRPFMNNQIKVDIRYAKNLPILRYIVPFSYLQEDLSYDDAKNKILATKKWKIGTRKELAPYKEEDLYDHVYNSLVENKTSSVSDTNIGMFFTPTKSRKLPLVYSFNDGDSKKYDFFIKDVSIFIFKTGIGLFVYEASLPQHDNVEEGYIKYLDINQLILFQNRFKELNVVRGYMGEKNDKYCFYPKGHNERDFYTLGREIAIKLNKIFNNVSYYPPRVNDILKNQTIYNLKQLKEKEKNKKNFHKSKFDKKIDFWKFIGVSDYYKLEENEKDDIFIVPDKALLYSYVVMNTNKNLLNETEIEVALSQFCTNLYYLTRGYKPSYRVSYNANEERKQMFRRHGNDFWDASLEGVGDFVLLYDNLFDYIPNNDGTKSEVQKYNKFFDDIRVKEIQGDYFLLYILLLYQHYSVVFFSEKISRTIPMQKNIFMNITKETKNIKEKLKSLKIDVDMFFANCMFESVGQITDICTIYSFIDKKMQVKKNIESLQHGIHDLDKLREEIDNEEKNKKEERTNKILNNIGILAIISILFDSIQFMNWIDSDILPIFKTTFTTLPLSIPQIYTLILLILLIILLVIRLFLFFTKVKTKKR